MRLKKARLNKARLNKAVLKRRAMDWRAAPYPSPSGEGRRARFSAPGWGHVMRNAARPRMQLWRLPKPYPGSATLSRIIFLAKTDVMPERIAAGVEQLFAFEPNLQSLHDGAR